MTTSPHEVAAQSPSPFRWWDALIVFALDLVVVGILLGWMVEGSTGSPGVAFLRVALLGLYLLARRRLDVRKLFGHRVQTGGLALGAAIGILFAVATAGVIFVERLIVGWVHPVYPIWVVFAPLQEIPFLPLLVAVIVAPVYEEIVYRSIGYRGSLEKAPVPAAAALSAALFAFGHWWAGLVVEIVIMTFLFGLAAVWLLRRTRSLWPSVAAHVTYNSIVVIVGVVESEVVGWGGTLS